jgi:C-terminal processing protease CtpA/Prc
MRPVLAFLCTLVILVFCSGITAQNYLGKKDMQEDLQAMNRFVQRHHPSPFYARDSSEVQAFAERQIQQLPDSLSLEDFWRVCYRMITYYNDAHTRMTYTTFYNDYAKSGGLVLPILGRFASGKLILTKDLRDEPTLRAGTEIRRINGQSVNELWDSMEEMNRGETEEIDRLRVNQNMPYYFWLAYGGGNTYSLTLADGQQVDLRGIPLSELSRRKGKTEVPKEIVNVRYPNDSVAVLYIRNFYHASKKYYKKSFDAVFKELRQKTRVKYLLIDNRYNDGGDNLFAEYLCRYFADQPFRSAARSYWYVSPQFKYVFKKSFIPGAVAWIRPLYTFNRHTRAIWRAEEGELAEVPQKMQAPFPARKQFQGEVIMMNDVGTFSAGSMFAAMFKDFDMGLTIGRPTGNISSFYANNIMRTRLPHSKLRFEVSTSYQVRPNGDESLRAIQPDVYVPEGVNILDFTLKRIAAQNLE